MTYDETTNGAQPARKEIEQPLAVDPRRNNRGTIGNRGGQPGRSGPPRNQNARKHGLRAIIPTMYGEEAENLKREIRRLRGQLEKAVMHTHGEITLAARLSIGSACRHEFAAMYAGCRLAELSDERTTTSKTATQETNGTTVKATTTSIKGGPEFRLAWLDRISRETDLRDRSIARLDLDRDVRENIFDALYRTPRATPDATSCDAAPDLDPKATEAPDATEASVGNVGAIPLARD